MKKERIFKNSDIINCLNILEDIRVNLTRIGRVPLKSNDDLEKFLLLENLFINDFDVYKKLTAVWETLISNYSEEEEEELDEIMESRNVLWKLPFDLTTEELHKELRNRYSEYIDFNSKGELD